MATKQELLSEAYRRGILPPETARAYEEAQKRGLFGASSVEQAPAEEKGFVDTAKDAISKRAENVAGVVKRQNSRGGAVEVAWRAPETIAQAVGQGAGAVVDVSSDVAGRTLKGAYGMLPENTQKFIGENAKLTKDYWANTGAGKLVAKGANYLGEKYAQLEKENPDAALALSGILNIPAASGVMSAVKPVGGLIKKAGVGAGNVSADIHGRLTGLGSQATKDTISAARKTPGISKKGTTFGDALSGKTSGDDIVGTALTQLKTKADDMSAKYSGQLNEITKDNSAIPKIKEGFDKTVSDSLKQRNIRPYLDDNGALKISYGDASTIVKGRAVVNKALVDTLTHSDASAKGLDALKKRLSQYISQVEKGTPAESLLVGMRQDLSNRLKTNIPKYAEMTKEFHDMSGLIEDIEKTLMIKKKGGKLQKFTADQTLRRLLSSTKDNFTLRKNMVDALTEGSEKNLGEMISGYAMSAKLPAGLAGVGPSLVGEAALTKFVSPWFAPLLAASSPRLSAEFLWMAGKTLRAKDKIFSSFGRVKKMMASAINKADYQDISEIVRQSKMATPSVQKTKTPAFQKTGRQIDTSERSALPLRQKGPAEKSAEVFEELFKMAQSPQGKASLLEKLAAEEKYSKLVDTIKNIPTTKALPGPPRDFQLLSDKEVAQKTAQKSISGKLGVKNLPSGTTGSITKAEQRRINEIRRK